MKNLSHHIVLLCELVISLLTREIQMEEMSKQGWPFELVKHAIWSDFYTCNSLVLRIPDDRQSPKNQ
jgi:hypothetical protein